VVSAKGKTRLTWTHYPWLASAYRNVIPEFNDHRVNAGRCDGEGQEIVILVEGVAGDSIRPATHLRTCRLIDGNRSVGIWEFTR